MEPQANNSTGVNAKYLNVKHRKRRSASPPSQGASKVTNDAAALLTPTKLSWCRRLRDLYELHVSDLGGWSNVSSAEAAILRRALTLIIACEARETQYAEAGQVSDQELCVYASAANTLRRLLESIGLKRRQRDVTPLNDLIRELDSERAETTAADGDVP
jgi:hypothetical protein